MSTPADADTNLLKKVLLLEAGKGYSDGAISGGGLDDFVRLWLNTNKIKLGARSQSARYKSLQLENPGYAVKSLAERKQWVDAVLAWLDEMDGGNALPDRHGSEGQAAKGTKLAKTTPRVVCSRTDLELPVTVIKGVGEDTAKKFGRLGLFTVRDLLYFFPRRFLDFSQRRTISQLEVGKEQTVTAIIWEARIARLGNMKCTEAILGDETGNMRAVWFNQPYIARQLKTNSRIVISGKVTEFNYTKVFENPQWELFEDKDLIHTGTACSGISADVGIESAQCALHY